MKCKSCGIEIGKYEDLAIQEMFKLAYCSACGNLFGKITKSEIEEKNNGVYSAIIKMYIK